MKRLVLVILFLGLATVTVPPLRQRVDPHLDVFRLWLGAKLEGPMSPILDPYREIQAKTQLGHFVSRLTGDRNRGRPPPEARDFANYLVVRKLSEDGLDPWGVPYTVQQRRDSLYLISAGRDAAYGTADDIRDSMRYAPSRSFRSGLRRR